MDGIIYTFGEKEKVLVSATRVRVCYVCCHGIYLCCVVLDYFFYFILCQIHRYDGAIVRGSYNR